MFHLTPPMSPSLRHLDCAKSTATPNEDVPWFSCKGKASKRYLKTKAFDKQMPMQAQVGMGEVSVLEQVVQVKRSFMLIKCCARDSQRALQSREIMAITKLRKSLCTAFSSTLTYLKFQQSHLSSVNRFGTKKVTPTFYSLVKEIEVLLTAVGFISDIPNIKHLRDFNISQKDTFYYDYVHAALDIWWNSIAILQIVNTISLEVAKLEVFYDLKVSNPFLQVISYFLKDFCKLSIHYYHSLRSSAPFPCDCFQEFWILLINLLDKPTPSEEYSFWFVYSSVIQELLNSSMNPTGVTKIEGKDLTVSCLWLTSYLAKLYKYDSCGNFCESKAPKSEYGILKILIEKVLSSCIDVKEENIRCSLFHTMQLISIWEPNCDVILPLADFYLKKIDEMFCSSGVEVKGLSYLFNSSTSWFQYINNLSSPCTVLRKESSYDIFLHIITKQLTKDSIDRSLWRFLKGRIYSKLTTKKIKELSEVGIQNSFSLFLAIAESGQLEVTDKICELSQAIETTWNPKKQSIAWKALFVLMHIHQRNGSKLNKIISKISKFFNDTCSSFSTITRDSMHKSNVMNLLLVYIDSMGEVFQQCHNLSLSEYQLIGSGFSTLLSSCGVTEINYILNVFLNILMKVKNIVGDDYDIENYAIEMQYTTFLEFIFTHIFPFIENISTTNTPPELVADIASLLMSLSYKFASLLTGNISMNYYDIFLHFATKENVNILIMCRFLCFVLEDKSLLVQLKRKMLTLENKTVLFPIVFQSWLKGVIYIQPPCNQMQELTVKVLLQEDLTEMFPRVRDLNLRSSDHVFTSIALFRIMGETYEANSDYQHRKLLREHIFCYFKGYVPCVLKRITSQRDGPTLSYVYKHISHLIEHCAPLIYLKGNSDSILPKLIDKTVIPHLVYPKDKASQTIVFCAIKEYLSNFIRGLFKLDYRSDTCIQREIKDIMSNYVCHYPPQPNHNPITRLMIDTVNGRPEGLKPEAFNFWLEIVRVNVLLNSSSNPMNGFSMLYEIFKFTPLIRKSDVITVLLKSALEVYMKQGNLSSFLRELIKKIVEYFKEKNLNDSKSVLIPILQWFIKEKMQWATAKAFSLLDTFAEHLPQVFQFIVPFLNETVKTLEINRGSGPDDVIREYLKRTLSKLSKSSNSDKMI